MLTPLTDGACPVYVNVYMHYILGALSTESNQHYLGTVQNTRHKKVGLLGAN